MDIERIMDAMGRGIEKLGVPVIQSIPPEQETDVDDLVTWLRAQLDEDERLIAEYESYMAERAAEAGAYVPVHPPGWGVGEPFDPARVLREVESKRATLDWYDAAWKNRREHPNDLPGTGWLLAMVKVVKLLALPYADRPGYQEEWKP